MFLKLPFAISFSVFIYIYIFNIQRAEGGQIHLNFVTVL